MTTSILTGHVLTRLAELPERHFHCLVTSPPFYGLRAYGTEPQVWGGVAACPHEWGSAGTVVVGNNSAIRGKNETPSTRVFNESRSAVPSPKTVADGSQRAIPAGARCRRCHAWRGELGAEPLPSCGRVEGGMLELRRDLTDEEREYVYAELKRAGLL